MLFKKSIQTIWLGFALWVCLLFGVGQNPIMAANLLSSARMTDTISTDQALKSLMANRQPLLVDVRSPSEYRSGHPSATNIPPASPQCL
jgi:hypothetical protein